MITLGLNIGEGGKLRYHGRFHNAGHTRRTKESILLPKKNQF